MTPARILAPAALVAAAIALFTILASGGGETDATPAEAPAVTATAKPKKAKRSATPKPSGGTYTVKPGDTPSGIAEKLGIDVDDLLAANPEVDPGALTVGEKLELP